MRYDARVVGDIIRAMRHETRAVRYATRVVGDGIRIVAGETRVVIASVS